MPRAARPRRGDAATRSTAPARAILAIALSLVAASAHAATVTDLRVVARGGQAFITFREVPGDGVAYAVYRSTSPITSTVGLTPIATLAQGSGLDRYTDHGFVIADEGQPLAAGTGLLVWTTSRDGTYFYAVAASTDPRIVAGADATAVGCDEKHEEVPGAVRMAAPNVVGGVATIPYYAWEDLAAWDTAAFGYYGFRYTVSCPAEPRASLPVTLVLHGAGENGYHEPAVWSPFASDLGVLVYPTDLEFWHGIVDPMTGAQWRFHSGWFGYPSGGVVRSVTERRLIRYLRLVQRDPRFHADPTRAYVYGGSMGGGGAMHLAAHHPEVFAAGLASIGWTDPDQWSATTWPAAKDNPPVDAPDGPRWRDWLDQSWLAAHRDELPPMIYTFSPQDRIIPPTAFPALLAALERHHHAYIAEWRDGGHNAFVTADLFRYRLGEAHPAFADAASSDATSAPTGQRNLRLDWSSSLHPFGADPTIVDAADRFAMSFRALDADTTAEVTIRAARAFRPAPGATVAWTNTGAGGEAIESGTVQADRLGLATVRMRILRGGDRLVLVLR